MKIAKRKEKFFSLFFKEAYMHKIKRIYVPTMRFIFLLLSLICLCLFIKINSFVNTSNYNSLNDYLKDFLTLWEFITVFLGVPFIMETLLRKSKFFIKIKRSSLSIKNQFFQHKYEEKEENILKLFRQLGIKLKNEL